MRHYKGILLSRRTRQMQRKRAPLGRRAHDSQTPAHRFGNALGQRKTQTRSVDLSGCHRWTPVEGFENVRQIAFVDSDPEIRNGNLNLLALAGAMVRLDAGSHADPARSAAVLERVGDEVLQTLREGETISNDFGQVGLRIQFNGEL